ncbi:aldehyde dehydrogenase [Peptococcus simiae]|uniref:Aldehyde dehydrogenase n=1 Tax=Peptococcus simiae TaxID=1643805 RepID=A0ABW9H1G6_9FIRM
MIKNRLDKQKHYFNTGVTRSLAFRKRVLLALKAAIQRYEKPLVEALAADLNKSAYESYMTEIGLVIQEINHHLKSVDKWMKPVRHRVGLNAFPGKAYTLAEPYGLVLILSPWNYPVNLTLMPLVGALAAGNCVALKPSEFSPYTTAVLQKMFQESFSDQLISVFVGDASLSERLLEERYDYIFFTGSSPIGKKVMSAAANHLTPVTLELGGKSPCIITADADLSLAAKHIAFGKILNAGQTCVAPDYVLADAKILDRFVLAFSQAVQDQLPDGLNTKDYPKIINRQHFDRLLRLMADGEILVGGQVDADKHRIAPTVISQLSADDAIMQEEIFGPLLPILPVQSEEEALDFISQREKPLATYIFSQDKQKQERLLRCLSYGGACINDTISQITCQGLPFGGVGYSGMGAYHGAYSFRTFSHEKSIYKKSPIFDLPVKYGPYPRSYRLLKWIMR